MCPIGTTHGRSSDLQATYLSQLPSPFLLAIRPVLCTGFSFLLTAAGQLRILTGFPIKPNLAIGYLEVKRLYQALWGASTAIYSGYHVNIPAAVQKEKLAATAFLCEPKTLVRSWPKDETQESKDVPL